MVHYKFTYFNAKGLAEVTRLLFAYTDTPYEDVRVEQEEWKKMKPSFNAVFGQLPELQVDGVKIAQSNAIARYVARQYKLAGKTSIEEAHCDMIVDHFEDFWKPIGAIIMTTEEDKKDELKKKFVEEQAPDMLTKVEKILVANGGGNGFLVGDSLTWADLTFFNISAFPEAMGMELKWDDLPKLKALRERIAALPKIKAWIDKRPQTAF